MDRENADWLADLKSEGEQREAALRDLREILMRILPRALSRWMEPGDPHFDPFLEDVAQETLLRVLDRLETFEGRSKFTTWVYTIAIRIALSELRLRKWKEASLEYLESGMEPGSMPYKRFTDDQPNPESSMARRKAVQQVMKAIEEALTPRQRTAMVAVIIEGVPLTVVADRLDTNRNALYKLMHDARLKLKQHLESEGYPPEELLKIFKD